MAEDVLLHPPDARPRRRSPGHDRGSCGTADGVPCVCLPCTVVMAIDNGGRRQHVGVHLGLRHNAVETERVLSLSLSTNVFSARCATREGGRGKREEGRGKREEGRGLPSMRHIDVSSIPFEKHRRKQLKLTTATLHWHLCSHSNLLYLSRRLPIGIPIGDP